jgi:hypothetical protein
MRPQLSHRSRIMCCVPKLSVRNLVRRVGSEEPVFKDDGELCFCGRPFTQLHLPRLDRRLSAGSDLRCCGFREVASNFQ